VSKYARAVIVGFVVAFVVSGALSFLATAAGREPTIMTALPGMIFGVITAYLLANLAGNRKVRKADEGEKGRVLAFQPEPGQGLLIVFREGFVGSQAGLNVLVDDRFVAQLKSPRFTAVSLPAGEHRVGATFGGLAEKQNRPADERFTLLEGEVVAYRAAIAMGALKNTVAFHRVADREDLARKLKPMTMVAPEG
jgi:hypothetical protein